jgi:hypothetical protein
MNSAYYEDVFYQIVDILNRMPGTLVEHYYDIGDNKVMFVYWRKGKWQYQINVLERFVYEKGENNEE